MTTTKKRQDPYCPDTIEQVLWELADVLEGARTTQGPATTERAARGALRVAQQMLAIEHGQRVEFTPSAIREQEEVQQAMRDQKLNLAYNLARHAYDKARKVTDDDQAIELLQGQQRNQEELINALRDQVVALDSQLRSLEERLNAMEEPERLEIKRSSHRERVAA